MNTTAKKIKMSGKTSAHTQLVIRSQIIELIRNEQIKTTPHKAKILKGEFDRLINQAKQETDASRRLVASFLRNSLAMDKLFQKILPRLASGNSGYITSARALPRKGDNAEQMIIQIKGAELRERKSRLGAALERREKKEAEAARQGVAAKVKERVSRVTKVIDTKKKENIADTRRVSK
jgi:large subunit ribosomal protein L17